VSRKLPGGHLAGTWPGPISWEVGEEPFQTVVVFLRVIPGITDLLYHPDDRNHLAPERQQVRGASARLVVVRQLVGVGRPEARQLSDRWWWFAHPS
jgi:hypothetical protein